MFVLDDNQKSVWRFRVCVCGIYYSAADCLCSFAKQKRDSCHMPLLPSPIQCLRRSDFMKEKTSNFLRTKTAAAIGAFLLATVLILGARAFAYKPPEAIHYHANFAVYINGQREQFKDLDYYEESATTTCSASETEEPENTPMSRTHMHGSVNDVVHVEDGRVTWGNFFTVLGWNVGNTYVATRNTVYKNDGQAKVTYILNGKNVATVANTIIGDQDKLLVAYGDQPMAQIMKEYNGIKNDALKADQSKDPASCGSHENSVTIAERMKHMF